MAVLIGVTIGGIYGYVNKARKVMDLQTARAIVDAQVYVKVQKGAHSDGNAHTSFINEDFKHIFVSGSDSDSDYFELRVLSNFSEAPECKFSKDYMFCVTSEHEKIVKIILCKMNKYGFPDTSAPQYELYPNVCKEFQVE